MYIWISVAFYSSIAIFKMANSFIQTKLSGDEPTSYIKSYTKSNLVGSVYWEIVEVLGSLVAIYTILKVKSIRSDFVIDQLLLCRPRLLFREKHNIIIDQSKSFIGKGGKKDRIFILENAIVELYDRVKG